MKLGVFNPLFDGLPLEAMLDRIQGLGLEAVELPSGPNSVNEIRAGHYPGQEQCDTSKLLSDQGRLKALQKAFNSRNLTISALSCHGNPVHPDMVLARVFHQSFTDSVLLAEKPEVPVVVVFSGCPGGSPRDETPNWIIYWQTFFRKQNGWLLPHARTIAFS